MEKFAHIISPDNKVSFMEDRIAGEKRECPISEKAFSGIVPNAEAQLIQEPSAVRTRAPEVKISEHPQTFNPSHPETEVTERPSRRKYSVKYKLQILNEIDSSAKAGEIGAILRREGLYASTVANWRLQKKKGLMEGLSPKKRGPKSSGPDEKDKQIKELELQNRKLQRKLARAHLLLDIQKKISEITGTPLSEAKDEEDD